MIWKRPLHLIHRWLGILLCLLMAAWFVSGMVMMYVPFPQLTPPERRAALPELAWPENALPPAIALAGLRASDFRFRGTPTRQEPIAVPEPGALAALDLVRLARIQGRPAFVVHSGAAQPRVIFADTGERLGPVLSADAVAAAATFRPGTAPRHLGVLQSDQWTVSSSLNLHRPLHRIGLDDTSGTEVYVSSTTGEVVRDTQRRERWLNLVGAITHWIYPHVLRRHPEAWSWTVNILAFAGTLLALSGLAVGALRIHRASLRAGSGGTQRWIRRHWVVGLLFGGTTLTFVFSGWMSMNPGQLNPPAAPSASERATLEGPSRVLLEFPPVPRLPAGTVEAELHSFDGGAFILATLRTGERQVVPSVPSLALPSEARVRKLAPALLPDTPTPAIQRLLAYDNNYYTRNPEFGRRPLPVLRVVFEDAAGTWFHLDPSTGAVVDRSTRVNRLHRHLYHGLHSLDWWWLWSRRPLWDIFVLALCIGGLLLSASGVAVGLRRLRQSAAS